MRLDFASLLMAVLDRHASDLHLTAGNPPMVRVRGAWSLTDFPVLDPTDTREIVYAVLNNDQRQRLETDSRSTSPTPFRGRRASASTPTSSARRWQRPSASFLRRSCRSTSSACRRWFTSSAASRGGWCS